MDDAAILDFLMSSLGSVSKAVDAILIGDPILARARLDEYERSMNRFLDSHPDLERRLDEARKEKG